MCTSMHVCMLAKTIFSLFLQLRVCVCVLWHGLRGISVMATPQGEREEMMRPYGGGWQTSICPLALDRRTATQQQSADTCTHAHTRSGQSTWVFLDFISEATK